MRYLADEWILICSMRLEGHAASWFSAQRKAVREGERRNWLDFAEFSREFVNAFSPHDEEEAARRDLKELRQLGRVSGYTAHFHELCYRIPGMSEKDKFSAYFLGLVPRLQPEVGLRLDTEDLRTVERATQVAQRAEEYLKVKYPKDDKKKMKLIRRRKMRGHFTMWNRRRQLVDLRSMPVDKKKTKKQNQRGQNWRGRGHGRGGGRGGGRGSWQR